jgi:CheY-like chemotaxis protein
MVLGVEQLQHDLALHHALLPDAHDTLAILREQSEVVTHILNDVLSLQKIEDNALTLEYRVFDLEHMVRATLHSFKAPCADRQLGVRMQLTRLDMAMQAAVCATFDASLLAPPCLASVRFGVFGDTHRLRQVLSNYVSNAIKFSSSQAEIRVSLSLSDLQVSPNFLQAITSSTTSAAEITELFHERSVASVEVRVAVIDTGAGISPEHLPNLFQTYMQIDAGRIQKSKGTGLGLSVSKSIIELHNGHVGCVSREGHGAEFFFAVPMQVRLLKKSRAHSASISSSVPSTPPSPPPPPPQAASPLCVQFPLTIVVVPSSVSPPLSPAKKRPSVLVVEDSVPNRKLLCALLRRLGCDATPVENGQECVDLLLPHVPVDARRSIHMATEVGVSSPPPLPHPDLFDLVLMDNSMPLLDGMTTTRILRLNGVRVPIVGVTGNALEEDIRAFIDAGADRVLTKPIAAAQLKNTLRDFLRTQQPAAAFSVSNANLTL